MVRVSNAIFPRPILIQPSVSDVVSYCRGGSPVIITEARTDLWSDKMVKKPTNKKPTSRKVAKKKVQKKNGGSTPKRPKRKTPMMHLEIRPIPGGGDKD